MSVRLPSAQLDKLGFFGRVVVWFLSYKFWDVWPNNYKVRVSKVVGGADFLLRLLLM